MAGDGQKVGNSRVGGPLRPCAAHIAFATVWRELEEGSTVYRIADETGTCHASIYRLMALLRKMDAARIVSYEPDALGRSVAVWALGRGADAKKQLVTSTEKSRRYRAKLAMKPLQMLGRSAQAIDAAITAERTTR